MTELFLKIINMSISASWLVLAVLMLRLVLKKAPKWVNVLLWGIVAIRLICPFSFESALSLIPSAETIPLNIGMDTTPTINSGINAINNAVNPVISQSNTPMAGTSVNPLQITIGIYKYIWIFGMIVLALYMTVSYWHLHRTVDTAVRHKDNIFQSENVSSPFVLGIIKPRIYLPFNMNEQDLEHVVAHEQAHIRRKDHWWKPLGFLLLTLHWFNPLMWLAYVLLCCDIELACDETVIKKLGNDQRADYTQALVSCSVNRRMIAACPLAFGEAGVKERVKSVMNYKKPAFWIVILAVITCIAVAICFLTNPAPKREFPINGSNVSELDTNRVIEMIAKTEKLDDGSQLCVNEGHCDLIFTSDFEWANDGAIQFFYMKNQKTYSAQLRMFHDDNKYFITDSEEWIEQVQFFKLFHYLDALKYMPQEEIRKLSPDADGFSVYMRKDGVPGDYERVLKYGQNGVEDIEGWYIHLEVQPLHEVGGGAYNGSGDEVIHIFYGHQDFVMLENTDILEIFRNSILGDETIVVTDYVYADDGAFGLDGVVQYTDETGTPWKLAFVRDGVVHPVSQDRGTEHMIASELTYLGNGTVQVYVEDTKDGAMYQCSMEYTYDSEESDTNFKATSNQVADRTLTQEEIDRVNDTFSPILFDKQGNPIGTNIWSCFFTSYYADVRDMNFAEFLAYFLGDGSVVDDAEFAILKEQKDFLFYGEVSSLADMPVPVHRYPVRMINLILKEYAGITVDDLDTADVNYLSEYDAFYNYTSDAGHGMFTCTRGEIDGDIVRLYEEFDYGTDVLKVEAGYQIVSHQPLNRN